MKTKFSRGLFGFLMVGWMFAAGQSIADTLVYSEANNNPSWFSPDNWFTYDSQNHLQPVFHPPVAGDTAIVSGTVDAQGNSIPLATLIVGSNAKINNGSFVVGTVQMSGGTGGNTTAFTGSALEILTEMDVTGGSCVFANGKLGIDDGAVCNMGFNGAGQLTCTGSQVINDGQISLQFAGSFFSGGTNLMNLSGAVISSSTNTFLTGDSGSTFDNSGTVRSDAGALTLSGFKNWTSTGGLAKYKTTAATAQIIFSSGLIIPANVTNLFSGPGTNILAGTTTNNGTMQIGVILQGTQNLDAGVVEFSGILTGTGTIHVVALPALASALVVNRNAGGTITGLTVNIDVGALFLINYNSTGQGLTIQGAVINNSGTITWSGAGGITMLSGAVINNLAGALFDVQTPTPGVTTISGFGLPNGGAINNTGTFRKSSGPMITVTVDFNNNGLLDVESAQVQLTGGTSSGTFNTAAGTEIWFSPGNNATNFLASGVQFTGTNFVRAKVGTVLLLGNVSIPNFSLEGSVLDGPGQLTITTFFQWSNGTMQGTGAVVIPASTSALLTGGTFTQRTFNNSGTVTMTNTYFLTDDGATFNNLASGVLLLKNSGGFGFPNSGKPRPALNNFGSILTASSTTSPLAFIVTNHGSVLLQSNQFNCYQYVQVAGTTTIASNAILDSESFGTLLLGGVVTGTGSFNGSFGVTNSGATIMPGNGLGTLTVGGNNYTQTALGVLSIEIGGTNLTNQLDRLSISGAALDGTLQVHFVNGFQPSVGDVYYFLPTPFFGSVTGKFATVTGNQANSNIALVPIYQGFGVNLVAVARPVIHGTIRNGTNSVFTFQTTAGLTNTVQFTDSLTPPNWQTLTNIVGNGTVRSVTNGTSSEQRYYRVGFK